jgi:hypothetical protein
MRKEGESACENTRDNERERERDNASERELGASINNAAPFYT